jgi:hypothetical protein
VAQIDDLAPCVSPQPPSTSAVAIGALCGQTRQNAPRTWHRPHLVRSQAILATLCRGQADLVRRIAPYPAFLMQIGKEPAQHQHVGTDRRRRQLGQRILPEPEQVRGSDQVHRMIPAHLLGQRFGGGTDLLAVVGRDPGLCCRESVHGRAQRSADVALSA